MQKKHGRRSMFSLSEVRLVLLALVIMVAVLGILARNISAQKVREAELEAQRQAEMAEREAQLEEERRAQREAAERAEAERIAAGPIVLGTDESGREVYNVDYSLGSSEYELDGSGGAGYGEILDLSAYGAYDGRGSFDYCYPKNLYSKVDTEDKGDVMNVWDVTTLSAEDGGQLVLEHLTTTAKDLDMILDNVSGLVADARGLSIEPVQRDVNDERGLLIWSGEGSGIVGKGVINALSGGTIYSMTVVCPAGTDSQDAQYKQFYMDSLVNLCGFSEKGCQTLSWDAYSGT